MTYSLLERHADGSWWYHKTSFRSRKDAEAFKETWINWDKDRDKRIIETEDSLPKETLWTYDLKHFYSLNGELLYTIRK